MEWLSKPTKKLLLEMSVGVLIHNVILGILAFLVLPKTSYPMIPALIGLAVGCVGAVVMLVHMAVITERTLETRSEAYANKTTVIQGLVRKVVLVAVLLWLWRWFQLDLLATVIGIMGMKTGAYLQPIVHKVFGNKDIS